MVGSQFRLKQKGQCVQHSLLIQKTNNKLKPNTHSQTVRERERERDRDRDRDREKKKQELRSTLGSSEMRIFINYYRVGVQTETTLFLDQSVY